MNAEQFDREVRLGIVLYGGVSLAVYISGVAQELGEAVRGRGVYAFIKQLIGCDVVVDIVSGASAGGINGVLLSLALANDLELDGLAALWSNEGDPDALLRSPADAGATSLLDGNGFFHQRLRGALQAMLEGRMYSPSPSDVPSRVDSVDLFVTATDFYGQWDQIHEALGQVIDVKDHHRVFTLKYRDGRLGDLRDGSLTAEEREEWIDALATVCQATATFPGASDPVRVPRDDRTPDGLRPITRHALLHDWSRSLKRDGFVLIDGGVLDNKPFTHTLSAIYRRSADRQIVRKLLYVEPDPERKPAALPRAVPDVLEVAAVALSTLPSYQSIRADLSDLSAHNEQVTRLQNVLKRVLVKLRPPPPANHDVNSWPKPRDLELEGREVYRQSRVEAYADDFFDSALAARERDFPSRVGQLVSRQDLSRLLEELKADLLANADTADKFLAAYDLDFPMSRLFHVTYALYDVLYSRNGQQRGSKGGRALLQALNTQLQRYKILQGEQDDLVKRNLRLKLDVDRLINQAKVNVPGATPEG